MQGISLTHVSRLSTLTKTVSASRIPKTGAVKARKEGTRAKWRCIGTNTLILTYLYDFSSTIKAVLCNLEHSLTAAWFGTAGPDSALPFSPFPEGSDSASRPQMNRAHTTALVPSLVLTWKIKGLVHILQFLFWHCFWFVVVVWFCVDKSWNKQVNH